MSTFSDAQKLKEVRREIRMRKRVYPGSVSRGGMTQAEADERIAILEAVAADYEEPDLFGPQNDGPVQLEHRGAIL